MAEEELKPTTRSEVEESEETAEESEIKEARKGLLIFWARMLGWLATGLGAPIATFAIKFGLFDKGGYTEVTDEMGNVVSSYVALNGWGIVSCVLIGFTAITILKEVIDAYSKKYSLAKQCLVGVKNRIVPIAVAIIVCYYLRGVLDQIIFCLSVIGIAQLAAIPLNPLPQWKSKKKGEEDYSDLISGALSLIKDARAKKGGK